MGAATASFPRHAHLFVHPSAGFSDMGTMKKEVAKSFTDVTWKELQGRARTFMNFLHDPGKGNVFTFFQEGKSHKEHLEDRRFLKDLHGDKYVLGPFGPITRLGPPGATPSFDQILLGKGVAPRIRSLGGGLGRLGVKRSVFRELDERWGPHTVDRMADDRNSQLPLFNSARFCPGSAAVDAFSQDWTGHINWVVPAVNLVGRVLQHLAESGARATVVVPAWEANTAGSRKGVVAPTSARFRGGPVGFRRALKEPGVAVLRSEDLICAARAPSTKSCWDT